MTGADSRDVDDGLRHIVVKMIAKVYLRLATVANVVQYLFAQSPAGKLHKTCKQIDKKPINDYIKYKNLYRTCKGYKFLFSNMRVRI